MLTIIVTINRAWNWRASFRLTQWLKIIPHMMRSYCRCCCINEPVIFSHCVHLKRGHRIHACPAESLLSSWRYCPFKYNIRCVFNKQIYIEIIRFHSENVDFFVLEQGKPVKFIFASLNTHWYDWCIYGILSDRPVKHIVTMHICANVIYLRNCSRESVKNIIFVNLSFV